MTRAFLPILLCLFTISCKAEPQPRQYQGYKLVWNDEFDQDGKPDANLWNYENGYVRNHEPQWYTPDNVFLKDGYMVIEARPASFPCPDYEGPDANWRKARREVQWTSGAVETRQHFSFLYGRAEIRARIPVSKGAWPAIWFLGKDLPWPANGEVDLLEYYQHQGRPTILANACWASNNEDAAQWDSSYTPLTHFTDKDPAWAQRFHVWRMDWDKSEIRLYVDDELLNTIELNKTINGTAGGHKGINPFHHPMYLLLNLALDTRVKEYNPADFPMRYEIDYVRIYQAQ